METVTLTQEQEEKFVEALLAAFPRYSNLEQMLSFKLNVSADHICGGHNYKDAVVSAVRWFNKEGRAMELLDAAREDNYGNPVLKAFAAQMAEIRRC